YPDIRYTGIPFEFLNRLVKLGATDKETMEKWPNLDVGYAAWFDPEMASYVFLLMAEEAGVKLMLNTYFCDAIVEENAVKGVIVQNKSGRQAVRAKVVVDATGEADVAASAGVPCTLNKGLPFGLITRIGNVNHEKVVQYLSENPVTEPDSEFKEWFKEYLVKQLGLPPEDAVKTGCYKVWTYSYPDRPIKKIWEEKGSWNFCPMEIWKLAQKAVKNGDLDIIRKVDGVGTVEAGWDGLYYQSGAEKCVHGNICMLWGPDGSNGEHVTKVEVAARKYTVELVNFLKKYFPGFEGAQIMDVGVRTMPRTSREIEGEYHFKREDRKSARFPDAVYTWVSLAREELSDIPFRILL
ncbi:MAG: FAD-dependent oxidoreductase, partial [Crenarchaeota archaeon]|nr:FAD-dependent oxidoreductase [Thermoproteota archaeon]